ncbi:hypothetical protein AZE42_12637 [Rhizopogon vesiculosus]|nr:hypothetical protein AZE42_12637 [Rhizopogon vesiculosus]
MTMMIH